MSKPLHILAKPDEVSERVVVAGDPDRVKQLSEKLDKVKLVNKNRRYYVYTGEYKDVSVSVATHGIGSASAAIVFEELYMLGAREMIRFGTIGGLVKEMDVGDIILPTGAVYLKGGGVIGRLCSDICMPTSPDPHLFVELYKRLSRSKIPFYTGLIVADDAFYTSEELNAYVSKWIRKGIIGVEMECAILFGLAILKRFKAAALLIISDVILTEGLASLATAKDLEKIVDKASDIVLETIIK